MTVNDDFRKAIEGINAVISSRMKKRGYKPKHLYDIKSSVELKNSLIAIFAIVATIVISAISYMMGIQVPITYIGTLGSMLTYALIMVVILGGFVHKRIRHNEKKLNKLLKERISLFEIQPYILYLNSMLKYMLDESIIKDEYSIEELSNITEGLVYLHKFINLNREENDEHQTSDFSSKRFKDA